MEREACIVNADQGVEPKWVAGVDGLELEVPTSHANNDWMSSSVTWQDLIPAGLTPNTVLFAYGQSQL
jgi:hypothetical protein